MLHSLSTTLPLPVATTSSRWLVHAAVAAMLTVLAGCASTAHRAPVEDRKPTPRVVAPPTTASAPAANTRPAAAAPAMTAAEAAASKLQLPGWENAGKPGYYTVKPGDTLIRIGLDNGQNWRDVARWSGLENPNIIEVGQVLRVLPPTAAMVAQPGSASTTAVASTRPVGASGVVESRPLDGRAPATVAPPAAVVGSAVPAGPASVASAPSSAAAAVAAPVGGAAPSTTARDADDELTWSWPANGPVATAFDDVKSKGLAITGKAGDPVLAAADGRVVYAGSGLRGYGNLVIVKHNATYLTAYAHNQALLVKEDQPVRRGQKIAEMGSSDAERVQLHFEVRRQGKPVDPSRLLPQR
jgi:lipoprotein NlpD